MAEFRITCETQERIPWATLKGNTQPRLHHHINWRLCVPKILHEKHRKASTSP